MHIFDDIERTYLGPAENAEGQFAYLNRSAHPKWAKVRAVMETWFAEYPLEHRNDLMGRIRDDSDAQHNSAYFELFLYTVFSRLGFSITIHPDSPTGKGNPDFLLDSQDITPFYVEATVVHGESQQEENIRKFEAQIKDHINSIDSPDFSLVSQIIRVGSNQPKLRKFKRKVDEFVQKASWEPIKAMQDLRIFNQDMEKTISCEGWVIKIFLIAKGDTRHKTGMVNVGMDIKYVGNESLLEEKEIVSIRKNIRKKSHRHGKMAAPYVIILNIMSDLAVSFPLERLMNSALWGNEGVLIQANTRVSAIIALLHATPSHIPELDKVYVCHNPHAINPLPESAFRLLQGDPLREILGLPPNWPAE